MLYSFFDSVTIRFCKLSFFLIIFCSIFLFLISAIGILSVFLLSVFFIGKFIIIIFFFFFFLKQIFIIVLVVSFFLKLIGVSLFVQISYSWRNFSPDLFFFFVIDAWKIRFFWNITPHWISIIDVDGVLSVFHIFTFPKESDRTNKLGSVITFASNFLNFESIALLRAASWLRMLKFYSAWTCDRTLSWDSSRHDTKLTARCSTIACSYIWRLFSNRLTHLY